MLKNKIINYLIEELKKEYKNVKIRIEFRDLDTFVNIYNIKDVKEVEKLIDEILDEKLKDKLSEENVYIMIEI